jgi:hypothetical protein
MLISTERARKMTICERIAIGYLYKAPLIYLDKFSSPAYRLSSRILPPREHPHVIKRWQRTGSPLMRGCASKKDLIAIGPQKWGACSPLMRGSPSKTAQKMGEAHPFFLAVPSSEGGAFPGIDVCSTLYSAYCTLYRTVYHTVDS